MYDYIKVLKFIWRNPQCFQSDFVRAHIKLVNEAACLGHITCIAKGIPLGLWHITLKGMSMIDSYTEGGAYEDRSASA